MHRAAAILDALLLGLMTVAMSVAIAAIIYQGPLSGFVVRGVGLTLIGGIVMGVVGVCLFSWRGAICAPQSTLAVVVALFAADVAAAGAADERAFATVAAYVAVTTLALGVVAWVLGRLRVGMLAGYFPLPVVLGFLAGTGYLLVMGGLGAAIGHRMTVRDLALLLDPQGVVRWLPWAAAAVVIVVLARRLKRPTVVPLGLIVAGAGFYLALWSLGLGLEDARREGLLIGPFPEGFLGALSGWQPLAIDGPALLGGLPNLLTAVGLGVIGTVLSVSSLEVAVHQRIDVDTDLRAVGIANLAAGLGGGSVGHHSLALTLLATGLGRMGPSNGWIAAGASALALAVGAPVIGAMPTGVFAAGIMIVGLNLLAGVFVDQRRGMPPGDYLVVLLILVVTAAFGFLWGVAIGLLAAALLFIVAFARIDALRLATTGARLRSRIERPAAEAARLSVLGQRAAVFSLEGFLFFGTAQRLVQRIGQGLDRGPPLEHVVVDFGRVRGLDTSAARALAGLDEACRARGVTLRLAGLQGQAGILVRGRLPGVRLVASLDQALEEVEGELLAAEGAQDDTGTDLVGDLARARPGVDLAAYFRSVSVPAGTEVIAQGAASDSLLVLRSGALRVEVVVEGSAPVTVAHCRPGALVGEIGLYAGVPRTARVVAEEASTFLRIDADALERMGRADPALLADFHRLNAARLARRLGRTTALLADAEILGR